jgi:hypothetical protein
MRFALAVLGTLAALVAAIVPAIASARGKVPLRLEWVAPAGCPSHADVLADIERTIGDVESSSFVVARVVVAHPPNARSFRAEVQLTAAGSTTSRALEADTCRAVANAAALIVALAINADALPSGTSPSHDAPTTPVPPATPAVGPVGDAGVVGDASDVGDASTKSEKPAPDAASPAVPKEEEEATPQPPAKPAAEPTHATPAKAPSATTSTAGQTALPEEGGGAFVLGAAFVLDTSSLPSTTFGAAVSAGWRAGPLDVELAGVWLAPRRATLPATTAQGADISLAQLGARACYGVGKVLFRWGPCAGVGMAWTFAHGFGPATDQPTDATGQTLVAQLGAYAAHRLFSHFSVRLDAGAVLPFSHPTFVIDGGGLVFQTPSASFRATLGVGAYF